MNFLDDKHKSLIERLERCWQELHSLQDLAKEFGIQDIFQDNGAKILQQLVYLKFKALPGREGNDAVSDSKIEWEMKSINLDTQATGFSTNHHTNHEIINKYKKVPWTFAIYHGIRLSEIYIVLPSQMQNIYRNWEERLKSKKMTHLNNPKIPVKWVRDNGIKIYPYDKSNPVNPDEVASKELKQ